MKMELFPFAAIAGRSRHFSRGFSLIELAIAVIVAAVVLASALPSFRGVASRTQLAQTGNDLVSDIGLARNEAVKRAAEVTLRAKKNDWNGGWEIVADINRDGKVDDADTPLRVHAPPAAGYTIQGVYKDDAAALTSLTFTAFGNAKPISSKVSGAAQLAVCPPDKNKAKARVIELNASGSVSAFTDASGSSVKVGC